MKRFTACLALSLLLMDMATAAAYRVDINNANERTLVSALEGLGQENARAIVDYRKEHGAFRSMEQLALVKGVGLGVVERNRERIVLGNGRSKEDSRTAGQQDSRTAGQQDSRTAGQQDSRTAGQQDSNLQLL